MSHAGRDIKHVFGEGAKQLGIGSPYQPNASAFAPNAQEQQYITQLQNMAYGQAPSAAEMQMRQGFDQASQQAQSLAASSRGLSPALAQRMAQMAQSGMLQNVNQNAGIMRAQEQQSNMGMLGNELQSVRTGQMAQEGMRANAAENTQNRRTNFWGGVIKGGSSAFAGGGGGMAHGGMVPGYAYGNDGTGRPLTMPAAEGGTRGFGAEKADQQHAAGGFQKDKWKMGNPQFDFEQSKVLQNAPMQSIMTIPMQQPQSMIGRKLNGMADGGQVQQQPMNMSQGGGRVPGTAQVAGDSTQNDTQPAMLSPGEIVIPRSILDHEHAGEMAKSFVEGILAGKKKDNYADGGIAQKSGKVVGQAVRDALTPVRAGAEFLSGTVAPAVGSFFEGMGQGAEGPQPAEAAPVADLPIATKTGPMSTGSATLPGQQNMNQPNIQMPNQFGGLKDIMAGIQAEAKAQGELGNQNAQVLSNQGQAVANIDAQIALAQDHRNQEQQRWLHDMANDKIDPNKYLHSQSTGQKVMSTLGLLLGGMGQGMIGGSNPAMDFINSQIDRDINAQKENMNQKNNLYKANLEMYGDDIQAQMMTKANLLGATQIKLQQLAAKSQSPLAMARAKQASGLYQAQIDQLVTAAAQKSVMMQKATSGQAGPSELVRFLVPEHHQKAVFDEIKNAENTKNITPKILDAFERGSSKNPITSAQGQRDFEALINTTITDLEGTARQAAFDSIHKNMSPSGLTASPGENSVKRKTIENYLTSKSSAPTAKGYGIDLSKFPSTAAGSSDQSNAIPDGSTASNSKGQKIMMQGGKWVPVGK